MPELHVSVPCDVRGCQDGDAARQVQQHAEIASIQAVNEDSAEEGNEQTGQSYYDYLEADFYGGMGGGEDVPAHRYEVHAAAEERDEHGEEEKAEAALGPDDFPVDARSGGCGACHSSLLAYYRRILHGSLRSILLGNFRGFLWGMKLFAW